MDDFTYLQWLLALTTGTPVPGEHPPEYNPLLVLP